MTLRARHGMPSLRTNAIFGALHAGLSQASRNGLRLVQFSIQNDHVHLIVEAVDRRALSRGLQGLAIRIAKRVNRVLGYRGRVWADRYHARALRTPREMRNALVYVLQNWRKHLRGARGVDARSSGIYFDGWQVPIPVATTCRPVVSPRTWLGSVGWRRLGLLRPDESPAPRRRRR